MSTRWMPKIGGTIRFEKDGKPLPQIALPIFGYKSHSAIDRRLGFIRGCAATSASHADIRMFPKLVVTDNTSSEVWADSAYRPRKNEKWLASRTLFSRIHRRKPACKPMPQTLALANAAKSSIRAAVKHGFAHQKNRFGHFIRTVGIARAEAKLILANIAYNFDRLIFHERARATGEAVCDPDIHAKWTIGHQMEAGTRPIGRPAKPALASCVTKRRTRSG